MSGIVTRQVLLLVSAKVLKLKPRRTLTSCEDAEFKTNGVVLVCDEEEHSVNQDTPNGDVCQNPGWE